MACTHLKKLYQLCQEQELFFSGSDLVRVICKECGAVDVCPTALTMDLPDDADVSSGATEQTTTQQEASS